MMYIIKSNGRKLKIISITNAYTLQINFSDGIMTFQKSIDSVIKNILNGDELFVDYPTKKELDIGKQLLYSLFKI